MEAANLNCYRWQKHCEPNQSAEEEEEGEWWGNSVPEVGKAGDHIAQDAHRNQH